MKNTLRYRWHDQREQQHQEGEAGAGAGEGQQQTPPPLIGEDFSFRQGWQEVLPEEYRATGANFKSLPDVMKSLVETKRLASGKLEGMVKLPGEGATPEELAAFHRALGVPEKPEDYGLTKPEGEAAKLWNEEEVNAFLKEAHSKGIPKAQAEWLVNYQITQRAAAMQKEMEEGRAFMQQRDAELRAAFGNNAEKEMNAAKRVLMTIDPSYNLDEMQFLPAKLVIGLASFARKMHPDTLVSETQFNNQLKPSDVGTAIISDPTNPDYKAYHDPVHPQHEAVVKKVLDSFK